MKILAGFFILLISSICFAQAVKPKPAATPITEQADTLTVEDKGVLAEYQLAKNEFYNCQVNYFSSKDDNKLKVFSECKEKATTKLVEIYGQIAKKPNAIKLLTTIELEYFYQDSVMRTLGIDKSQVETDTKSQTELQRIIVLQNMRIIELLEQLVKKK